MITVYILILLNTRGAYIEFNSLKACEASANNIRKYHLTKAPDTNPKYIKKGDCVKIYREK